MKKEQCRFSDKLNAYLDAELSKHDFDEIQNHLKHCHLCQNELREIINVNTFLSSYQEEEIPEYLNEKILTAITNTGLFPQRSWLKRKVLSFSVAASIIVSFATGVILSDLTFNQETTSEFEFGQETLYSFFEGGE